MVNPFPDLLIYGIFAPALLRVVMGAMFLYIGVEHYRSRKAIRELLFPLMGKTSKAAPALLFVFEFAVGALLVMGAWTQLAALLAIALSLKSLLIRKALHALLPVSKATYFLLMVMALSLLLSGAGGFAFDLPL